MSLLNSALDALRCGLAVFPLKPRTKDPAGDLVPQGSKDRTTDEQQVRTWWTKRPDANIGVTAGVVLDVDKGINSLDQALSFLTLVGLPRTLAVRTGRRSSYGVQFHFKGQALRSGPYQSNGVSGEIRSGNLYGLWAGSIHPDTGEKYEIVLDLPIAPWPNDARLGHQADKTDRGEEYCAYSARERFEQLLAEAWHAAKGNRNYTANAVTWFSARAFLAGCFEYTYKPTHIHDRKIEPLSEAEVKKLIFSAVQRHYKPGERDVRKMLADSWRYGIAAGPLKLDSADYDRLFKVVSVNDNVVWHLLSGVTTDFPGATAARDYLEDLLKKAGFEGDDLGRVLRRSGLDEAVAGQVLAELMLEQLLTEKE